MNELFTDLSVLLESVPRYKWWVDYIGPAAVSDSDIHEWTHSAAGVWREGA